ncbi:MAG: hypothetical protein V1754_05735 [Pseudomonadota bacterium]
MSEKEIRATVRQICEDLDKRARYLARNGIRKVVLPAVLGAGLAMSGCGDETTVPLYGVPPAEAGVEAGLDPAYMGPDVGIEIDQGVDTCCDASTDLLPLPEAAPAYMGPDVGPNPDSMLDDGAAMLYMAPDPESKPQ